MAEAIAILVLFNLIFFWEAYRNPFQNCTSELASTYFPQWRDYKFFDRQYYFYPLGIPFLSMFYPVNWLMHKLSKRLSIDSAFFVLHYGIIAHYILGSFLAFIMFKQWCVDGYALICAISYTYGAYSIKINNPTIAFTINWIPAMFINGWFGAVGLGMCLLTGYYPILIYTVPIAVIMNPISALGFIIGAIQLVPFWKYLTQSARFKHKTASNGSKASIFSLLNAITGTIPNRTISGLGYPEAVTYCGILSVPCLFFCGYPLLISVLIVIVSMFVLDIPLARNPIRSCFLLQCLLCACLAEGLTHIGISWKIALLIQVLSLMRNRYLIQCFPFHEQWRKPSEWFESKFIKEIKDYVGDGIISGLPFPHFTGYINGFNVLPYTGGFALDGFAKDYDYVQGVHDFFEYSEDYDKATRFGIKFAYSMKELKWNKTRIPHLYVNQEAQMS